MAAHMVNNLFIIFYFIVFFVVVISPFTQLIRAQQKSSRVCVPSLHLLSFLFFFKVLLTVESAAAVACEVHRLAFETPVCGRRPCVSEQMGCFEIASRKTPRFTFDRRLPSFTARSEFLSTVQRQYGSTSSTQSVRAAIRHATV